MAAILSRLQVSKGIIQAYTSVALPCLQYGIDILLCA